MLTSQHISRHHLLQDTKGIINLIKKSAEQGYAPGQNGLGYCYMYGIGTERNPKLAFEWSQKSAWKGDDAGQYNLA